MKMYTVYRKIFNVCTKKKEVPELICGLCFFSIVLKTSENPWDIGVVYNFRGIETFWSQKSHKKN